MIRKGSIFSISSSFRSPVASANHWSRLRQSSKEEIWDQNLATRALQINKHIWLLLFPRQGNLINFIIRIQWWVFKGPQSEGGSVLIYNNPVVHDWAENCFNNSLSTAQWAAGHRSLTVYQSFLHKGNLRNPNCKCFPAKIFLFCYLLNNNPC